MSVIASPSPSKDMPVGICPLPPASPGRSNRTTSSSSKRWCCPMASARLQVASASDDHPDLRQRKALRPARILSCHQCGRGRHRDARLRLDRRHYRVSQSGGSRRHLSASHRSPQLRGAGRDGGQRPCGGCTCPTSSGSNWCGHFTTASTTISSSAHPFCATAASSCPRGRASARACGRSSSRGRRRSSKRAYPPHHEVIGMRVIPGKTI